MRRTPTRRLVRLVLLLLPVVVASACTDAAPPFAPTSPLQARVARTADLVVAAAEPAHGKQGETGKVVTITGSGFAAGAVVAWERDGVADAGVVVRSAVVLSATEIAATIDIAQDAELDLYDISVTNLDKKKGIGAEKFEVTQAIALPTGTGSASYVRSVNEAGQAVGYAGSGAAFWDAGATSVVALGGAQAWGIDEAGSTIVGTTSDVRAVVWTGSAAMGWSAPVRLPERDGSPSSRAFAVASDPVTGLATIVGGNDAVQWSKRGTAYRRPVLWRRTAGAWVRGELPMPTAGAEVHAHVNDVNSWGEAVGAVEVGTTGKRAVVWDRSGSPQIIGPLASRAQGINGDGTIVVGDAGSLGAAYWHRGADGGWSGPIELPGTCAVAMAVDDLGRIVGLECSTTSHPNRRVGALWLPGDGYATVTPLSGLGDPNDGSAGEAISRLGTVIGGGASFGAAIWRLF